VREEGERPTAAIEGAGEEAKKLEGAPAKDKQPTVEEESTEGEQQVAKQDGQQVVKNEEAPKSRYWVSERSVGEFYRSFSFPQRIDQEAVKASLNNGILSIVIPKGKAPQPKKINIE